MESQDVQEMDSASPGEAYLPLSVDEQRVLALYDQLQELRLEIAIINAQKSHGDLPPVGTEDQIKNELLDARARYKLRNDAVETVVIANPILKAVHAGVNASPVERDLLPYVERRDEGAQAVAEQAARVNDLRNDLTRVQADTIRATRENVDLASELIELAEQVKQKKAGRVKNSKLQGQLAQLETEVKASRARYRIIKGVASGIVAGSGVDWSRDEELCSIVLDPEDEF